MAVFLVIIGLLVAVAVALQSHFGRKVVGTTLLLFAGCFVLFLALMTYEGHLTNHIDERAAVEMAGR